MRRVRTNLSLAPELVERLNREGAALNWSQIAAVALENALDGKDNVRRVVELLQRVEELEATLCKMRELVKSS